MLKDKLAQPNSLQMVMLDDDFNSQNLFCHIAHIRCEQP